MRVKLIALDLDGTLLDSGKNVPEANRTALRRAAEAGVRIVLASGRMTASIEPYAEKLGIDCYIMSYNGACAVGRVLDGRPRLLHRPLDARRADRIIEFHERRRIQLNYYLDDVLYSKDDDSMRPMAELYSSRTGSKIHYVESLRAFLGRSPTKLILLAERPERDALYEELSATVADDARLVKTDPEYLEILSRGADKGAALASLCETLGLSTDEAMAVGDNDNDAEMIAVAGVGVAMKGSSAAALAEADYVTRLDNSSGGVAEAVERFVLEPISIFPAAATGLDASSARSEEEVVSGEEIQ